MIWRLGYRYSPAAIALHDRHYSRRPTSRGGGVAGPYRHLVLLAPGALWVSVDARFATSWRGAWRCSVFRNESPVLSSDLVRLAVAATVAAWGPLPLAGMVTTVDASRVRKKRDPGRCFLRADWTRVGETRGGLVVLRLSPCPQPEPRAAEGQPLRLF